MGTTVLVVEDEEAISGLLRLRLEQAGHAVRLATDGPGALRAVEEARPDVVLLDIGLPGLDGIEVCRRMREAGDWTPIIFLTARDDEVDRVVGLELGADDYVTKPFSPREVLARVAAIVRRSGVVGATGAAAATDEQTVGWAGVRLDLRGRRGTVDDEPLELTAREFDLLAHLLGAPGQVFSRVQLLQQVWGADHLAGQRTVDVHVAQLRAKLGDRADLIRTVRGVGYASEPGQR